MQPFVENSVVHGVQNSTETCKINIKGTSDGEFITFVVQDTGVGMSKEKVEQIRNSIAEKQTTAESNYAIKNVKERLELTYGSQYVLNIDSECEKGTVVTIKIPVRKGEICH